MGDSVKVAIRVRPFNSREKQEGAVLCVEMRGNTTKIWNPETKAEREFNFDYSYWSHDGFVEQPNGVLVKDSEYSQYADQQQVFNDLGIQVLNNAWEGYHTCLFAYGQTGSGKSYSIVGYPPNKGIIPMACEEIFGRIHQNTDDSINQDVKVSMLEIYNEQIQDLLAPPSKRVQGGLKIRENPKAGVFVEGLIKQSVTSYPDIEAVLDQGNKHRTIGATQMNATSSRAHTVLTITFTQVFHDKSTGKPLNRKTSDINLVDLAGSERASKTGATGARLAEGSNINRSLSTLGKVITALAKRQKGGMVPYRESKLTRILQNALGGNSKTTMIAAISPATFNFEETLSTLRYADQVKSIKNSAVVNETPQEKLIRELKEENERLKKQLGGGGAGLDEETIKEYQAQIAELQRAKEEAEKNIQERMQDQLQRRNTISQFTQEVQGFYFVNLNEDPQLSGRIKYPIPNGQSTVGKVEGCDIKIMGLGVEDQHCTLNNQGQVVLQPNGKTLVNGEPVSQPIVLNPQDRIRFGNHLYFTFMDSNVTHHIENDWQFAVQEATQLETQQLLGEKEAEMRRKEEEMQLKMKAEWEAAQRQIEEERRKLEEMLQDRQNQENEQLSLREQQLLQRQKEMEDELRRKEEELKEKEKQRQQRSKLDMMVTSALQISNEANERASMLGKSVRFRPEIIRHPGQDGIQGENMSIRYRVMHPGIGDTRLYWDNDSLEERVPDMAEMCNQYFNGVPINEIDIGYDPFALNPEEIQSMLDSGGYIGMVTIMSEALYHLLDIESQGHSIYSMQGNEIGKLVAGIVPSVTGKDIDEEGYENLEEVIGEEIQLEVEIQEALNLPSELTQDVYCSYSLNALSRDVYQTVKASGQKPQFNYKFVHSFIATKFNAKDLQNGQIIINVFGSKPHNLLMQEANQVRIAMGLPEIQGVEQQSNQLPPVQNPPPVQSQPPVQNQPPVQSQPPAQNKPPPSQNKPPIQKEAQTNVQKPSVQEPVKKNIESNDLSPQYQQQGGKPVFLQNQPSDYSSNVSLAVDVSKEEKKDQTPIHVESQGTRNIREENERLKLELQQAQQANKSGCCEVI